MTTHETLLSTPRFTVERVTGQEGPRYDPYSYEEFRINAGNTKLEIHMGLAHWVRTNDGPRVAITGKNYCNVDFNNDVVEKAIGYSIRNIYRFKDRLTRSKMRSACSKGGKHDVGNVAGFPGEHVTMCYKCGKTFAYFFCQSAVE